MGALLMAVLLAWLCGGLALAAEGPALPAKAYLLMDAATGDVLHEYQGYRKLPVASTTKIMTAIIALERGNLTDTVTVSRNAAETGGSTIWLQMGEEHTLEDLLYALMLESANDAAVAIAEHLAGSEAAFAAWMNEKAREIGARNTHFVNSHGLHHPDHYSTAYDLARIARYALNNPDFRRIVTTTRWQMAPGYDGGPARTLYNHNRLLGYYEGATGVKNGFTEEAGLTNVASARRGETELIAVVLGAPGQLWTSTMALLDFGFHHYRTARVVKRGEPMGALRIAGAGSVQAVAAEDVVLTLPAGVPLPERRIEWERGLTGPLPEGARLGRVVIRSEGQIIRTVDLIAAAAVPAGRRINAGGRQSGWGPAIWSGLLLLGAAAALAAGLNGVRTLLMGAARPGTKEVRDHG